MHIATDNTGYLKEIKHEVIEAETSHDESSEVERLREEMAIERDQRLRLAAEFDNYRRRVRREQANAADAGKREMLEELISMSDDLERALASLDGTTDAVAEVLKMTLRRFRSVLESQGVTGFDSEGEKFDPERHEAFDVATGVETESGIVHAELRRGYFWKDKLFRPALVVVAM